MSIGLAIGLDLGRSGVAAAGIPGGALVPLDPATVTGRVVHFAARSEVGLNDGDAVSTMTDQSGNSRNATQTLTKRPTYKTGTWNSHPVYRFAGAQGSNTAAIDLSAGNALTIYVVGSATDESQQMFCEFSDNINSNNGSFYFGPGTKRVVEIAVKGAVGINTISSANTLDTTATARIATAKVNLSYGHQEAYCSVDGDHTMQRLSTSTFDNTTNFGSTYTLSVGCRDADASTAASSVFLTGDIAELIVYTGIHDAATQAGIEWYLSTTYGVTAWTAPLGNIVFQLDSLTNGGNSYYYAAWPYRLVNRLKGNYFWVDPAVNGRTIATAQTAIAEATVMSKTVFGQKNIAFAWGGTNDMGIAGGSNTAATTLARLWTYCDALKAAGFRVAVPTCLPRSDGNAPADFNTKRATLNASIVSQYASHADVLIDIAADSRVGDDGDSDVTTYYDADKVHLNVVGHRDVMSKLAMTAAVSAFGVAEIVPTDITGLVGWWEADNPGSAYADGDPVGTWSDLSGNANHATGTTTQRPTYKTSIQNGKPVMRFDGVANGLITPAINLSATSAVTLIVVGGNITAGATYMIFEMSTNNNSFTDSFAMNRNTSNNPDFVLKGAVGLSSYDPTGGWSSNWVVTSGFLNKARATREAVAWRNGSITGTRTNNSNNLDTEKFGNRACYIGARAQTSLFLAGDLAAILLYNRELTGGERTRLDEMFAAKYALY